MQLVAIPPDRLVEAWPRIQPFAEKIERRFPAEWPTRVIMEAAGVRELQLWLIWDEDKREGRGVVGTRVIQKASGKRVLDIAWMAGEGRKDWLGLLPVIEQNGVQEGCEAIEFEGRNGWAPDLPDYATEKRTIYRKKLDGRSEAERRAA